MPDDQPERVGGRGRAIRGAGVVEAVAWTVGYLCVQVTVAVGLVVLLVLFAFARWPQQPSMIVDVLTSMPANELTWLSVYVTGGATLVSLFVLVPAVCWRLRPGVRQQLGTHSPSSRHLVLLMGAVLPLAILSDELYGLALHVWELIRADLGRYWPAIADWGHSDTIDLIRSQTEETAYPLLLMIVGVGPAIGEELVFRGVIGRGLVGRLGIWRGVLLTSLLFAAAHGTPAHALATLPLAVFLHLTYLATRTIWAPILVHFLNNALSVTMLKYGLGQSVDVSLLLLGSAMVYVVAVGALLWNLGEGHFRMSSGPRVARCGLASAGGELVVKPVAPLWLTGLAACGVLGFTWTFVSAAMAGESWAGG